ncbi:hypothetical protein PGO52_20975 [Klebsiella aerogenes]
MSFYNTLSSIQNYDENLERCISSVISNLEKIKTSTDNPGVLLGKIQSGKTRGFLGIIAKAFDHNYDIALVLTKGTKTLAKQTVSRIQYDFKTFVDNDTLSIFDIMEIPERLTRSEINRKLIIVVKKETKNLDRLIAFFNNESYENLASKKVILIDDEADMGSIRFVKRKSKTDDEDLIEQGRIAQKMDELRHLVINMKFLQVTATPYSLYLQPDGYTNPFIFLPKKPAFTELLPIHNKYVGGDDYFGKFNDNDPRYYLHIIVPEDEQNFLRPKDELDIDGKDIFSINGIDILRKAFINFLVAIVIRRWQQKQDNSQLRKYAMIVHNDTQRKAHQKQLNIIESILSALENFVINKDPQLNIIFKNSFDLLKISSECNGDVCPDEYEALDLFKKIISDGEIIIQRVNSDVELSSLLDPATAELRLRTQANVFIGGSLLDRGITIPHLLSFYYGRNPRRMQADTVLQHSRMYGARDRKDLAVTRFYTSQGVYTRLKHVHEFDTALRIAFENRDMDSGVVFLESDSTKGVIPCSPAKVSASQVLTLNPGGYFLPTGFDITDSLKNQEYLNKIDNLIKPYISKVPILSTVNKEVPFKVLDLIKKMIDLNKDEEFDWKPMYGLINYYCSSNNSDDVKIFVATDRKISKDVSGDKSGLSIIGGKIIRDLISEEHKYPVIAFLRQEGGQAKGWANDSSFWWPILISPSSAKPCIYSLS